MSWLLIINDKKCKKDFQKFLKENSESVVFKSELEKTFKNLEQVLTGLNKQSSNDLIVVNSSSNMHVLKVNEIIHCSSSRSYTDLHLSNGKKLTATKTLKEFETILEKYRFTRIHHSHLVNINHIEKYVKGEGGYLVLDDGTKIPVATRKKEYLLRELERL